MHTFKARPRLWIPYAVVATAGLAGLLGPKVVGQGAAPTQSIPREDTQACLACHSSDMTETVKAVNAVALQASPHKDLKCQDCHASITAAPHTAAMLKTKASCSDCHQDALPGYSAKDAPSAYAGSVHARVDKAPGDHPTCISCHGAGDPHAVKAVAGWPRKDRAQVCASCHADKVRMARYGVDPDAVRSYEESFHGKALLRLHMTKAAACSDCHHAHNVLPSTDPAASTNRAHAAETCAACHPGAKVNFAMSGVNHLRLAEKQSPVLRWEELFFRWLTAGTIILLLLGVALDLCRRTLGRGPSPRSGRLVAFLVSLSFLCVTLSLLMAWSGFGRPERWAVAGIIVLICAFIVYLFGPRKPAPEAGAAMFPRLSVSQRWQHGLLLVSFTLLVATGLPMRFCAVDWLRDVYLMLGGLGVLRLVHRVAASVMIVTWIWHTIYLLVRWKQAGFSLKSWTMFPTWKDVTDFVAVSLFYVGLAREEPRYDRFQFREKFDYFAVYWGMPIMVFSGLVLWFPVALGNRLPKLGISVAYIAHSDEAVLAFLAIAIWHLYNVHFNPNTFPMSPTFYTGTKTREEMEREHPLELERKG